MARIVCKKISRKSNTPMKAEKLLVSKKWINAMIVNTDAESICKMHRILNNFQRKGIDCCFKIVARLNQSMSPFFHGCCDLSARAAVPA